MFGKQISIKTESDVWLWQIFEGNIFSYAGTFRIKLLSWTIVFESNSKDILYSDSAVHTQMQCLAWRVITLVTGKWLTAKTNG